MRPRSLLALLLALAPAVLAQPARPLVVAHRGASGYLPEHTLAAKAHAHALGADFLEQDIVLTKDDVPVVLHDVYLDAVTDVARRFPGRARPDGRHYALDFTLAELRQLEVRERVNLKTGEAQYPARYPSAAAPTGLRIPTLEEELTLVQALNRSTGRVAGIYPEIKAPRWHREQGRDPSRVILPVLARDEEPEPSTQESMFSYIRLSDGGTPRHVGPRAEVEIIADLALRVLGDGGPVDWRAMSHTSTIRNAIAAIVPGLEQIAEIDRSRKEFSIPGRALDTPAFPTADGKARLFVHDLPPAPAGLTLMTIRSEWQFNTVVYEEEDLYRNQTRRDVVLIHPDDVRKHGLVDGGRCRIASAAGEMRGQIVAAYDQIRPGCVAMYYPESNVLVPKAADPLSRTPAYKNVAVTIVADDAAMAARPQPELVGAGTPREKMNQCG